MWNTRMLGIALIVAASGFFWARWPALGHEARQGDKYSFEVGFVNEPVFRGFPNAVDIFITRTADGKHIDRRMGDVVDLAVEVQLREKEAFDSRILQSARLGPIRQGFGDKNNEYTSWFLPTVAGTYAFHITGTVSDDSDPLAGPQQIDMNFVCGKGTRSDTSDFDCARTPQLFPSGQ
jgi:hypothetical protein